MARILHTAEPGRRSHLSDSITTSPYGEQTKYDVTGDGDPTVDFHLVADSSDPIYIYFKTEFQKKVNLWMSTWDESEWSADEESWKAENEGDFTWKLPTSTPRITAALSLWVNTSRATTTLPCVWVLSSQAQRSRCV